ncbi:MAG TPA: penicillin acylase family protein [Longimicrobiales bacterium]|nr:penicillin acylase family protein [Longimicrobiales bacterium]
MNLPFLRILPLVLLAAPACAPLSNLLPAREEAGERLAASVTIVRDEWGVPSILGPTDAAVMFGLAYAQAEDNYWQIEEDYIHLLGRASNWYGERYLAADLVRAVFEVERLSREEYEGEPPERKVLWDAFAAGLNYYLRTTPGVQPRLITRWEPWMFFARFRLVGENTRIDGVRLGDIAELMGVGVTGAVRSAEFGGFSGVGGFGGGRGAGVTGAYPADASTGALAEPQGSNMWAIAGSRTESGHALLFQNPHVRFFGDGQRYEMHVHSDQGWHVRGFAVLGTPVPRSGHNEHLAWSHTNTGADHSDVYEVVFDHPSDPLMYRYDDGWRQATEWTDTIRVNTAGGVVAREFTFRRTHHGPVVAMRDGVGLAVRVGRMEEGGSIQQWYEMGRARNLDEFRAALNRRAFPISNTMYADVEGNIYYLHGNAVPRRADGYDWSRPVDGSTSATEWQGWHELDELPEILNPRSGWIQNTNGTPFLATGEGDNLDPSRYPTYMAPEPDNGRARSSRRLLEAEPSWTLDALQAAAFDTYVSEADGDALRILIHEWEEIGGTNFERAMRVDEALDALRSWDRVATVASEATTLFILWQERLRSGDFTGEYAQFRALEDVVAELNRNFGRALVPWGEVNRLQRVHTSGGDPARGEAFPGQPVGGESLGGERPSLPVPGAPGWAGVIFAFSAQPAADGRRYGVSGHTWVSVVELAPGAVESRSVVQFGQSADPASPHWFDQAPLYVAGRMKPAWFAREDVMANAARTYRPGPPPR